MRKLATIRRVAEIRPIENADAIEHVRVDGWWVVGKKCHFINTWEGGDSHVRNNL